MKSIGAIVLGMALLFGLGTSCRKADVFTSSSSAKLWFNKTLVQFDTVFTKMGSATYNFKVKNTNPNGVRTNITLAGGSNSYFRINVDGKPGTYFPGKELAGGDSMYVFVEVTLDGSNTNNPFIVKDSILFETNGNKQYVNLQAWGQNAIYLNKQLLTTPMDNTKPYVIMDTVTVPVNYTLTIGKGTKLYFHSGGTLLVGGSLKVNGDVNNPVIFQGDRLEHDPTYSKGPGQWQGIFFADTSYGNEINYAIIQNASFGIYDALYKSDKKDGNPKLKIHKCIIRNMSNFGYLGLNSAMDMDNTLIYNTGKQAFIADGGTYHVAHCTFDNLNSIFDRQSMTFYLTDQPISLTNNIQVAAPLNFHGFNLISSGTLDDETGVDLVDSLHDSVAFKGCVFKSKSYTFNGPNTVNIDPGYSNLYNEDYHLGSGSLILNKGWTNLSSLPAAMQSYLIQDIEGKNWSTRYPGCYSTTK